MSVFFLSINWHWLTIHHLVNELFIYCLTDKVGGLFISEEIPSEMEIAPRYTLLTLFVLFLLIKLMYTAKTVACLYAVREGYNTIGMSWWASEQNVGPVHGWMGDTN